MNSRLSPVYLLYPGFYPLLMLNDWIRNEISIAGIMISDMDVKHKGKNLSLYESVILLNKESGWRYTLYLLIVAKFAEIFVAIFNVIRRLVGKEVNIKTFNQICRSRNIPVFRCKDFNTDDSLGFIKSVNANLIVSAYNNQILKSPLINSVIYGAINIHPGNLPDFRGVDPAFEVLYHQLNRAGITIHYIDTGVDTGAILCQTLVEVNPNETLFSLNSRLWLQGARMLPQVLDAIDNGAVVSLKQDESRIKYPYKSFPEKSRVIKFLQRKRHLINWQDMRQIGKLLISGEIL